MSQAISIEKNWIIFDTCTVSKISIIGNATSIIESISNQIGPFTAVITPLVRFEFLRKANSKSEFEKFRDYLTKTYTEIDLVSKEDRYDIHRLSSELACVCRYAIPNHYKHIDMTDFIHGGLLRRYPRNLFLLTFDINDFPDPIFELLHHESIKINKNLEIWALYKFNKGGFDNLYNKFKKRSRKFN